MNGNHGGGEGARGIIDLCDEWWVVVFGRGVPTNND